MLVLWPHVPPSPSTQVGCVEGNTLRQLAACTALEELSLHLHTPWYPARSRRPRSSLKDEAEEALLSRVPWLAVSCKQLKRLTIWLDPSMCDQTDLGVRPLHEVGSACSHGVRPRACEWIIRHASATHPP